jgi:hypothetical protein
MARISQFRATFRFVIAMALAFGVSPVSEAQVSPELRYDSAPVSVESSSSDTVVAEMPEPPRPDLGLPPVPPSPLSLEQAFQFGGLAFSVDSSTGTILEGVRGESRSVLQGAVGISSVELYGYDLVVLFPGLRSFSDGSVVSGITYVGFCGQSFTPMFQISEVPGTGDSAPVPTTLTTWQSTSSSSAAPVIVAPEIVNHGSSHSFDSSPTDRFRLNPAILDKRKSKYLAPGAACVVFRRCNQKLDAPECRSGDCNPEQKQICAPAVLGPKGGQGCGCTDKYKCSDYALNKGAREYCSLFMCRLDPTGNEFPGGKMGQTCKASFDTDMGCGCFDAGCTDEAAPRCDGKCAAGPKPYCGIVPKQGKPGDMGCDCVGPCARRVKDAAECNSPTYCQGAGTRCFPTKIGESLICQCKRPCQPEFDGTNWKCAGACPTFEGRCEVTVPAKGDNPPECGCKG